MKNSLPSLDDMVFENRNKLYGAYALRTAYADTLRRATLTGIGLMLLFTGSSFVYLKNRADVGKPKIVELTIADYVVPDEPKDELPPISPPPMAETPPPVQQRAFIPPVPVPDLKDMVEVIPPDMSALNDSRITRTNVEGSKSDAVVFDAPPPPPTFTGTAKTSGIMEENLPFTTVELLPEFPGGASTMYRWLGENLTYPGNAVRANVEGKVYLKFIVEKDGSISQPQVIKGIGFGCDEEALRVLAKMPKWKPGMQNGRPVRVYFTLPVAFRLR